MDAIDINNELDMEHLIEVVGIVESVSVDCHGTQQQEQLDENGDTINFNATIVMAGRISFSDKLSNDLYLDKFTIYGMDHLMQSVYMELQTM